MESHYGRLSITSSTFEGNYGNGIKTKFVDGKYPIFDESETFCRGSISVGAQRFPQLKIGIPNPETGMGPCGRVGIYLIGSKLTVFANRQLITEVVNLYGCFS